MTLILWGRIERRAEEEKLYRGLMGSAGWKPIWKLLFAKRGLL